MSNEWIQHLQQKWLFLQSVKGEISVHNELFCRHQHWGSLHCFIRKLDLAQTSMAHKHILKDSWKTNVIKLTFQSGLVTFYTIKFCIICFYYVCFGLLMRISLAGYSAYLHELRVSCTLWSVLRSISGWFLNFKPFFSNSVTPLNLNKFCEYCIN